MPNPKRSRRPDPATAAAANTMSMACLAALLAMVLALVGKGLDVLILFPLLAGLLVILTRFWFGPPLILAAVLIVLMWEHRMHLSHHRSVRANMDSAIGDVDWLFDPLLACALLIFAVGHYRLLSLTRHILPLDTRNPGRPRVGSVSTRPHVRVPDSVGSLELSGVVLSSLLFTVLAVSVAVVLHELDNPFRPNMRSFIWQALVVLWTGSLCMIGSWALIGYLRLRQASPQESLQYLQDQLWLETYRDQGRLARWLTWARLRFQRRRERTSTTENDRSVV